MVWRVVRSKKVVDLLDMRTREMIKKLELVRFAHNWNVGILANIPIFLV
jgi:hypothetical protein